MLSYKPIALDEIINARDRIKDIIVRTPLVKLNFDNQDLEIYIKLENLHIDNAKVMRDLSNKLDISYNPAMTQSTYHGKLWWGDKVSGKDLNGVNPNFKNKVDEKLFFKKDIQCIESYLKAFILKYEYSFRSKGLRNNLIKFLPFKFELIIWFRTIVSMNIKEIILIAILWYRRVKLMDKNNYKFVKFPTHVGF